MVYGRNRSGSLEELQAFFDQGLEPYPGSPVAYETTPHGTPSPARIRGTLRVVDDLVRPEHFERAPKVLFFGSPQENPDAHNLVQFLKNYRPVPPPSARRLSVPLPQVHVSCYPSNPRALSVIADDPLEAWKDLVYTIHRFGVAVTLAKGERRELQNVKVVVEKPAPVSNEALSRYGFQPERLERYREDILSGSIEPDETYNYGNRIRA